VKIRGLLGVMGDLSLGRGIQAQIETSQSRRLRNSAIELMLTIFYQFFEVFQYFEIILSWWQLLLLLGGVKRGLMWLMLLLLMDISMQRSLKVVVAERIVARHLIWAVVRIASR
jgi:hypothetical protein